MKVAENFQNEGLMKAKVTPHPTDRYNAILSSYQRLWQADFWIKYSGNYRIKLPLRWPTFPDNCLGLLEIASKGFISSSLLSTSPTLIKVKRILSECEWVNNDYGHASNC